MKARTVALRDQLMAVLRDSRTPLSTPQLAAESGLPWWDVTFVGGCDITHAHVQRSGYRLKECGKGRWPGEQGDQYHTVAVPPSPGQVYPHLRALEAKGLIQRVRIPDHRTMHWRRTADPTDDNMNKLLEALESSDG